MREHDEIEIDLRELFQVMRKKWLIIVLAAVLGAGIAGVVTQFLMTPVYSSTTQLYVLSKSTSVTSLADIQLGSSLTLDYSELINTRPVIEKVIKNLELEYVYEEMIEKIEVTNPANTRFLKVKVSDPSAELAQKMADELAKVTAERVAEKMETDAPNIIEEANLAEEPDSPSMKMNVLIGFAIGLILSVGAIFVIYVMNDSVKDAEDVERYLGLTVLASIPSEKDALQVKGKKVAGGKR